jgi:hypothetical protein
MKMTGPIRAWQHLGIVVVLLAACAAPNKARRQQITATEVSRAKQNATRAKNPVVLRLDKLAKRLDTLPKQCRDVCCFQRVAEWRPLYGLELAGMSRPQLLATLRRLVNRRVSAVSAMNGEDKAVRRRALAMRWLSVAQDAADIRLLEPHIRSSAFAWRKPLELRAQTQAVVDCGAVAQWKKLTLGDVALAAIGRIIGKPRLSLAEYEAWKKRHNRPRSAMSYWLSRLPSLRRNCSAVLDELAKHDSALLVRLLVALDRGYRDPTPACPTPNELRALAKRFDRKRLIAQLQVPTSWQAARDPEHAAKTSFQRFAEWALYHAALLFEKKHVGALHSLLSHPTYRRSQRLLAFVAVGIGRLDPRLERSVMRKLSKTLVKPPRVFVWEFARLAPRSPIVAKWLDGWSSQPCALNWNVQAVIDGLVLAKRAGKRTLRAFMRRSKAFRQKHPALIRELADAAVKLGASDKAFACRKKIRRIACVKITKAAYDRFKAERAAAIPVCVRELRRWFW